MQTAPHPVATFRTDINGLRAWAVVAVVLYHFGVRGFGGGFVGVDVFFVISGYLMTGLVVRGLERGTFSLWGFYMARARRIVPALVVLCAVLLALGWFVILPLDYKTLGTHAIAALGFFSNFKFWSEAGYFAEASHEKWLLHTWSLSVEWQFYLLLPIALWAVWRRWPGRGAQWTALGVGFAVSLAAAVWVTPGAPSAAFFLLHTRAWEMLGGGLVFLLAARGKLSQGQRRGLEAAGLALILAAIFVFDARTAWPGWRAAVPVLGAMLVLTADRKSVWTGNRVAQWLGDRSYSLYLWHWPVFVALVYLEQQRETTGLALGMALTLVLGHLSYRWVENPARWRLTRWPLGKGLVALAGVVGVVAAVAVAVRLAEGATGRFAPMVVAAAAEAANVNPRREECHRGHGTTLPSCVYGGTVWKVIALGDSHVSAIVSGLAAAAPQRDAGVVQWSYSGCAFVPGMRPTQAKLALAGVDYQCPEFAQWARAKLDALPADIPVVLIGRYAQAAMGANEDRLLVPVPDFYFTNESPTTTPALLNEFARHITESACELARHRTVYMVRPIPEMGFDVPKTLSRRMAMGVMDDLSIPMEDYRQRNAWVWAAQDAARAQCGVRVLDATRYLCHDDRCDASRNGRPLYSDDDHLSESGNKLLVPMFAEVFRDSVR